TITSISGNTIMLGGGPIPMTLTGGDVAQALVGGDHMTVTGGASTLAAGGPGSSTCTIDYHTCTAAPLVIYRDPSQDGLWHGGRPSGITLHNFGSKPLPHVEGLTIGANCVTISGTVVTNVACSTTNVNGSIATVNGTITRSTGSWLTDGFAVGQLITLDVPPQQATVNISAAGVITRTDGGTWTGFAAGQLVTIDGTRVGYVFSVSGGTLTLDSTKLLSGFAGFPNPGSVPQSHLLWVAEVGTVSAINKTTMTLTFLTTNFSQLVSQVAAANTVHSIKVANRVGNGAPFFVFALADPFEYSG